MPTTPISTIGLLNLIQHRLELGMTAQFVTNMNGYMTTLEQWAPQIRANSLSMALFQTEVDAQLDQLTNLVGSFSQVGLDNNLTSTDATRALAAPQGKALGDSIAALSNTVSMFNQVELSNNLNTSDASKALSAPQGKALKELIDALQATVTANTNAIAADTSTGNNIGPVAGYTANTVSPTGDSGDYFIVSADINVDGVAVAANTFLRLNKNGGGTAADWDIDLVQTALLQGTGVTNQQVLQAIEDARTKEVGTSAQRAANTNTNIVEWYETDSKTLWHIIGGAWTQIS